LCLAVITNQPRLVEKLLSLGADATALIVSSKREHPLHFAASKGVAWLHTLRVLLDSRLEDIDVFNSDG